MDFHLTFLRLLGQWLNWQSSGLQNRRLGVRFPPGLPFSLFAQQGTEQNGRQN